MDPFLIPVQLAIIGLYLWRDAIVARVPEPARARFSLLAADVKFCVGTWWKTILLPVLLILFTYIVWIQCCRTFFGGVPALAIEGPLLLHVIASCILAPLSEQILQGIFLSAVFLAFVRIYQNRLVLSFMLLAALMIISLVFASVHINPTPVNWLVRFSQFMIYGGLYYLNDRNLLPAVVAHATWNAVVGGMAGVA